MKYEVLPVNEVEIDIENPRIKQFLEIYRGEITAASIALALSAGDKSKSTTFNSLKESIRVNKGLVNPIIVNRQKDGRQIVIEGNTRLQLYKEFQETDPTGPWYNIIAIVHEDLKKEEIHAIRLQTHLVGPREWVPFAKAKYLHELSNVEHLPMSTIISYCGGKQNEIIKLIDAYCDMVKYYKPIVESTGNDVDPNEFSKFAELQNRRIENALFNHQYTKEHFATWVVNGNIDSAQNVRKLPDILDCEQARNVFLKQNISAAEKYLPVTINNDLNNVDIYHLAKALRARIESMSMREAKSYALDDNKERERDALYDLLENLEEWKSDVERFM